MSPTRKGTMSTIGIPDCSTAQGVVQYIEQRITDLKDTDPDRGGIGELLVLLKCIEEDVGAMLDDMERESNERAMQMAIKMQDAGVTDAMLEARRF